MSHLHFKPSVDFTCVTELYNMARSGQLIENRVEAIDHAFYLGGSLNAWFAKDEQHDPDAFQSIPIPNELEGEEGLLDRLEAELGKALPAGTLEQTEGTVSKDAGMKAGKMNEVLAMLLKKFIEMILKELL